MRIIYCGLQCENYNPKRRPSFEYVNFYSTLTRMSGVDVLEFPFDTITTLGKSVWNRQLLEKVTSWKPDVVFAFMFGDEFLPHTLLEIKKITKSVAWFADDSWRFFNYSRRYAPLFTKVVTTYSYIEPLYHAYRLHNVIRSAWAANDSALREPSVVAKRYDVGFIGQFTPARGKVMDALQKAGISVEVRGFGWPIQYTHGELKGRVSGEEAAQILKQSKITLNINAAPNLFSPKVLARLFLKRSWGGKLALDFHFFQNVRAWYAMRVPQQKSRTFELAGAGQFALTPSADDIEKFYQEGKEMVFYRSLPDLIEKIKHYLPRDAEREAIAKAGYDRTKREHTYSKRFQSIFQYFNS